MLAPIIVFAYNKADHLRKTLTRLGQNELASESVLYVFCDGPKQHLAFSGERLTEYETYLKKIQDARKVAHELAIVPTFKEVHIIERNENYGLGKSIITGVTEIINKHGRAIVLEDDLETSPYFLSYMNQCLEHYDARKSVFSITGLSRPHPERFFPKDYPYDVYVSLKHHPWSWATWADRWNQVDWTAKAYDEVASNSNMLAAFQRAGEDEWEELTMQVKGGRQIWSARFAFAHFVNHAVSIAPIRTYVRNIGAGTDATNCTTDNLGRWEIAESELNNTKELRLLDVLYEDTRIVNSWYSFFKKGKRSWLGKLKNWYGRKFLHRDEYALKGKVYVS